jgi:hypothetical protein
MTDLSTIQGFQFGVTNVPHNFTAASKQNVKKRIENIIYVEEPPADAVKIAYVGSKEITPTNNLYIGDRSDSLYENTRTNTIQEYTASLQPISVENKNFIVTQIFSTLTSRNVPLYYKHVLTNISTIVTESVRIYDKDLNPISEEKYKFETILEYDDDTGRPVSPQQVKEYHLYNNLESYADNATGEYEVFFVQYTEVISGVESVTTKLLSNELAYTEATWEDIWYVTGELKPWTHAYTLDPVTLEVRVPLASPYSIKYEEINRLGVKQPTALTNYVPWFPRILNGKLRTSYDLYAVNYSIAEFSNQAFNPIQPYKFGVRTQCKKVDKYLINLPHNKIQSGSTFSYFYMTFELDGDVQYAITNDPFKSGDDYRDMKDQRVTDTSGNTVVWSSSDLLGITY